MNQPRKHAVVTGGGSGVGEAIALKLADESNLVTILGRRKEPLKIVAKKHKNINWKVCDISKSEEVKNCYNRLISYSGDFHGASSYYTQNEEDFRLTQVFFFFGMNIPYELVPQIRCSRYGI